MSSKNNVSRALEDICTCILNEEVIDVRRNHLSISFIYISMYEELARDPSFLYFT